MIVGATGGHRPPRYAQGLAVAVLIIVAVAVSQGALGPSKPQPSSSPTSAAIAQASISATPSSSSAVKTASPTSQLEPDAVPVHKGLLSPGAYDYLNVDSEGFNVQFAVPAGWIWNGRSLSKGDAGLPDGAVIFVYGGSVQVYGDPCHWAGAQPDPPTGVGAADIVAALASQPSRSATSPIPRPIGRWGGLTVELTVPDDLDLAACDGGQFRSWGPANNVRIHQGAGQRDLVWALDIPGGLIIDAASFPGTPPDVMSEMDAILGSMYIGHWG